MDGNNRMDRYCGPDRCARNTIQEKMIRLGYAQIILLVVGMILVIVLGVMFSGYGNCC